MAYAQNCPHRCLRRVRPPTINGTTKEPAAVACVGPGSPTRSGRREEMDWLRPCIEELRAVAKAPQGSRRPLAELQVNEFVQHQVEDLRKALEGLRNAVQGEATTKPREGDFWNDDVLTYIDTCLYFLERRLPSPDDDT